MRFRQDPMPEKILQDWHIQQTEHLVASSQLKQIALFQFRAVSYDDDMQLNPTLQFPKPDQHTSVEF